MWFPTKLYVLLCFLEYTLELCVLLYMQRQFTQKFTDELSSPFQYT